MHLWMPVGLPLTPFKRGQEVFWETMFHEVFRGMVVEDRGEVVIVNRISPGFAAGLELKREQLWASDQGYATGQDSHCPRFSCPQSASH